MTAYVHSPSPECPTLTSHHSHIRAYLSRPDVRAALGVDPSVPANFTSCATAVGTAFRAQLDSFTAATPNYIGGLLERGVRVLIYVGTYDWICNWVGNERWTLALEWSGQTQFAAEPLRPWAVGGDFTKGRAGLARSAKGLSFATIDGAGHMASIRDISPDVGPHWGAVGSLRQAEGGA